MLEVSSSIHIDCMSIAHGFRINYPIFRLTNLSPVFGVLPQRLMVVIIKTFNVALCILAMVLSTVIY